jgi:filamentous hemagglutinin
VALHTASGALGGGWGGAAGAAVGGASADLMQAMQDNIQQGLEAAGLRDGAAKGIAQGIAVLTAAGMGAAVGEAYGAASAATVDANNRQLHPSEKTLAKELAKKSAGKYTVEQIEEQMRLMGNKAFNEAANTTEVLTTAAAIANNINQDPNMPKTVDGMAVVEVPVQANPGLQQYIIGNSNGEDYIPGQSPYVASNPALNQPSTIYTPKGTTTTAKCANGDTACITGIGQQQSAPLTQQAKEAIADAAEVTSRGAGVIAAGATAVVTQGGSYTKPAQVVAVSATAVGVMADAVEQIARPDMGKAAHTSITVYFQEWVDSRAPGVAPVTNEVIEMWKNSGSGQTLETWANKQWQDFLERSK